MNGQHLSFYRHPVGTFRGVWRCTLRKTYGHKYSRPSDWLENAEKMMSANNEQDVLWRKCDENARRLIWC